MNIKEALQTVIKETSDDYAKSYALAALELGNCNHHFIYEKDSSPGMSISHKSTGKMMIGKELQVQILYVLSNLSSWRGEKAREVKLVLKNASKII